ncbi:MAG: TGS domain-containing protein [Desulfobacteraceae bacterium]|nr:TGS domain-containing protein [Desulfobacteraceae bacterium]
MPANLPPPYFEAEKRYRDGRTPEEKIEALEEMLTIMPKHKGTDKLRADLRKRIAKHKSEALQKRGAGKRETAYNIEPEGAAQAILIGVPNVGKSSIVSALTNAKPEVADFPHSTWKPTPGMANYENIQFQLIDTPPVPTEFVDPGFTDLLRRTDIIVIVVDIQADALQALEEALGFLRSLRIFAPTEMIPADLRKAPFIKKILIAVNKVDDEAAEQDYRAFLELCDMQAPSMAISTLSGKKMSEFLVRLYEMAEVIRVYTRSPGKASDLKSPFVLHRGATLEDLAEEIHKDFVTKLKFAKVWGTTVFDAQMVQRDYVLRDGDIVEIHI